MGTPRILTILTVVLLATPALAQFASDRDRRDALHHYRAGQDLMAAEQFEKAAQEFTRSIRKDRLLTEAHYGLGQANMALRRYTSAIHAFTACREAFHDLHALEEHHRFEVERQRVDEIRELRDAVRRIRAGQVKVAPSMADRLERRIDELQRRRTTMNARFQSPAEVSLALGSAYFRSGNLERAEQEWKDAAAANSRLGEAHNNLAALYAMTGRKKDAETAIHAAERAGFRVHPRLKDDVSRMN